jgi:cyanate lyase
VLDFFWFRIRLLNLKELKTLFPDFMGGAGTFPRFYEIVHCHTQSIKNVIQSLAYDLLIHAGVFNCMIFL